MSCTKCGKILLIISSDICFVTTFFVFSFWNSNNTLVRSFLVSPYVSRPIHIFYQYFFLSCSDCIVSIYLSANLLTLLFVIWILLLSLFSQLFIMKVYFLISIILFLFFTCMYIFVATFYFYIFVSKLYMISS